MTEVEEFILENQLSICLALAVLMPDAAHTQHVFDRVEIIRDQINQWKKERGPLRTAWVS